MATDNKYPRLEWERGFLVDVFPLTRLHPNSSIIDRHIEGEFTIEAGE